MAEIQKGKKKVKKINQGTRKNIGVFHGFPINTHMNIATSRVPLSEIASIPRVPAATVGEFDLQGEVLSRISWFNGLFFLGKIYRKPWLSHETFRVPVLLIQ